jgi:hypothetical protein
MSGDQGRAPHPITWYCQDCDRQWAEKTDKHLSRGLKTTSSRKIYSDDSGGQNRLPEPLKPCEFFLQNEPADKD